MSRIVVLKINTRTLCSVSKDNLKSESQTVSDHPLEQSLDCSIACIDRSLVRLIVQSFGDTLGRSIVRSLARLIARSLYIVRSNARSRDRWNDPNRYM